jgi:hypothetical protein
MPAADALIGLALLVLFFVVFYGPWQGVCTDLARQLIFERRDRLFDLAADGKLSFHSEQYRSLRAGLEGLIRFAHELTWPQLLLLQIMHKRYEGAVPAAGLTTDQAIAKIDDPETKKEVQKLLSDSISCLLLMMMLKSILVGPLLGVCVVAAYCTHRLNVLMAPFRSENAMVTNATYTIQRSAALV